MPVIHTKKQQIPYCYVHGRDSHTYIYTVYPYMTSTHPSQGDPPSTVSSVVATSFPHAADADDDDDTYDDDDDDDVCEDCDGTRASRIVACVFAR